MTNGYSQNVVWVTPGDVLLSDNRLVYVKPPVADGSTKLARQLFDAGITEGRGVLLAALCETSNKAFCYVWVPGSETEAEQRLMPRGVKMSVPFGNSRLRGVTVHNSVKWLYLRFKHRRHQQFKHELFK